VFLQSRPDSYLEFSGPVDGGKFSSPDGTVRIAKSRIEAGAVHSLQNYICRAEFEIARMCENLVKQTSLFRKLANMPENSRRVVHKTLLTPFKFMNWG
jgi:hypothetical protein